MRQRLGIAGALLSDPQLLLLDEPANGLDPAGIVAMRDTLRHLASIGKTVFVSSHLLAEVQQIADVVGIIAAGRLVREGTIDELLASEGVVRVRVAPDGRAPPAILGRLLALTRRRPQPMTVSRAAAPEPDGAGRRPWLPSRLAPHGRPRSIGCSPRPASLPPASSPARTSSRCSSSSPAAPSARCREEETSAVRENRPDTQSRGQKCRRRWHHR